MNKTSTEYKMLSYQWYSPISERELIDAGLPQLSDGEFLVNGKELTVYVVEDFAVSEAQTFRVAFHIDGELLPLYNDGEIFIPSSEKYATIKKGDNCYLGILK